MVSTICTGPNEPTHLVSWYQPLLDKLAELSRRGVEAIDGSSKEVFVLKAHAVALVTNAKAARQILRMKGHSSARGCRMCLNEGVRASGYGSIFYYPHCGLDNLTEYDREMYAQYLIHNGEHILGDFDFHNPPIRHHLRQDMLQVSRANNERLRKATGITGTSVFFQCETIHLCRSVPWDPMHAILLNVVKGHVRLLRGGLFGLQRGGYPKQQQEEEYNSEDSELADNIEDTAIPGYNEYSMDSITIKDAYIKGDKKLIDITIKDYTNLKSYGISV